MHLHRRLSGAAAMEVLYCSPTIHPVGSAAHSINRHRQFAGAAVHPTRKGL
jgi:hypothetical protein